MKTAHIIYRNYLNPNGEGMSIGGIQTYLTNLMDVLHELGYNVVLYQRGDIDFHRVINDKLEVYGCARPVEKVRGLNKMLYSKVQHRLKPDNGDILIFGCESMAVKTDGNVPVYGVQHGISWDVPQAGLTKLKYAYWYFKKQYRAWQTARRIKNVDHLVCVDCNFVNWYKALVPCPQVALSYIPNFSLVPQEQTVKPDPKDGINIIFARRFIPARGTRLFMAVAKRLLLEYDNIRITIAGDGEDEDLLKSNLGNEPHVKFIRYQSYESLQIHADKHIAVIPTLGSEGTSLSLLEAMASDCAVVCTIVGGMTNIIINEYNGLIIAPKEEELYQALKRLIDDDVLRLTLARRGRESLETSFSLNKWRGSWKKVLQHY